MAQAEKVKRMSVVEPVKAQLTDREKAGLLGLTFECENDYVLVWPIEKPKSDVIQESDHYKESARWGMVIAVGDGRVIDGVVVTIKAQAGDEVYITKYGEDVELDGVKCVLVHASEVKLRKTPK